MTSALRVVFPAPGAVELEPFDPGVPGEDEVAVRTICSLISSGTEGIVLHQLFSPGTGWADYGRLPFHPGYAAVGVVEQVGAGVVSLAPGDRVAVRRGHASRHVVAASECFPVPSLLRAEDAVWFALASIGFRGCQAARISLGDDVLVVGAGPIGQMLLRWAVVAGAHRIVVVDPLTERLSFALQGGASSVVDRPVDEAAVDLAGGGGTPGIIVDTTGNAAVFRPLLRLAPPFGRIVLLGDTGRPEEQRLTHDVVLKGLSIVGAHDGHERDGWTGRRVCELFFDLLAAGRFPVDGLITHRFAPADAAQAYELAVNRRERTMGLLFDWSKVR
ncbi:MAG TPA: zinc-binding dehydrogenase [Candidatus Limnocylindrales bacterium]|nr:zinc-binding dehydrogenase [Candidatus Limnocylindrales bacterium]